MERYVAVADATHSMYEFLSEGPMGTIRKVVQYLPFYEGTYNLGFGDWNEKVQKVEDSVRSNNMDRDKVLVTVAFTVLDFFKHYPGTTVLLEGSSQSRTRLYQMQIKSALHWINQFVHVEGFFEGQWEIFKPDGSYQAFAIRNK